MVPDNYLDEIQFEGKSAAKYLEESIEIQEQNKEAARIALTKYYELKYAYFDQMLDTLTYEGEKLVYGDSCKEDFFFYTYMTKSEIQTLECGKEEALYVFAPDMVK